MPLSPQMRARFVANCGRMPLTQIIQIVAAEGSQAAQESLLNESRANMGDLKYQQVWDECHRPSPEEVADWARVQSQLTGNPTADASIYEGYVARWEAKRPCGNHVDEARTEAARLQRSLAEQQTWNALDKTDYNAMIAYLGRYPDSAHWHELDDQLWAMSMFDEFRVRKFLADMPSTSHRKEAESVIDDLAWSNVDQTRVGDLQDFIINHPNSPHAAEASERINAYAKWDEVRRTNDLTAIMTYLEQYPSSPYAQTARGLLLSKKSDVLKEMRRDRNLFPVERFMSLLDSEVFTVDELVNEGLLTYESYQKLINPIDLPEITMTEDKNITQCPPDHTDVFLFGIPSTGKTCILMGLVNSHRLHVNTAIMGGEYASQLQMYVDAGKVPGRTYGKYCTAIKSHINHTDAKGNLQGVTKLNLIEMSGEEFAEKIANNPDNKVSFEDMGTGVTNLLKNNNRKAIFVVIDPTSDEVKIKQPIFVVDADGNKIPKGEKVLYVNQKQIVSKLFSLFTLPENQGVVDKIDTFNFIVSKADLLGNDIEREDRAYDKVMRYHSGLIEELTHFCKRNGINRHKEGHPSLFTFSLGKFYLGDVYDYDDADANKLIDAMGGMQATMGADNWWDKVKGWLNS